MTYNFNKNCLYMCVEYSEMKKWKNIFKWIILGLIVMFVVMLIIRWNRLDDTVLYADSLGIVSNDVTDVVFSVDLADKYNEDTKVNLYIRQELVKEMNDEGEDGDELAGDHVYSCKVKLKIPAGEFEEFYANYRHKKTNTVTIRGFEKATEESFEKSNATIHEIYDAASKYEDSATGYVDYKNVEKAVKEVCKAAKEKQASGEVLDIHGDDNSALIRTSNGIWYVYQPKVEGIEAFGTNVDLKIITMQPWYSFGPDDDILNTDKFMEASNKVADTFENVTYSATYMNQSVTRDVINSLGKNQIIVINTHGGYELLFGSFVTIGETFEWSDYVAGDCITGKVLLSGDPKDSGGRMCITGAYIKEYVGDLSNSMVYLGACESFKDHRLASSFRKKGADVVIGFTESVNAGYDRKVYSAIMTALGTYLETEEEYANVGQAMGYAKNIYGENDAEYKKKGEKAAEPVYIGEQEYRLFNQYIADLAKYVNEPEIVDEPEENLKEMPDYPIIAYGNFPLFVLTGHGIGFSAFFEDRGSKEANEKAKLEVLKYANEHVSGTDRVFLDRNVNRIKPVSKSGIMTRKIINNTVLSYFNDSHQAEGVLWRYMVYFYHDYDPDKEIVTEDGVVVHYNTKPQGQLYTKKTWIEWAKILILDAE